MKPSAKEQSKNEASYPERVHGLHEPAVFLVLLAAIEWRNISYLKCFYDASSISIKIVIRRMLLSTVILR
ncbi:MAG: hypothetical protein RIF33_15950 [Cyclobacteriaceae bacterium]